MSVIGTQFKINVCVEPIGGHHLSELDFVCTFFTQPNKFVTIKKEQMVKVDDDNYVAIVDSKYLSVGTIKMTIEVDVIDELFEGGRKEIKTVCTGIKICAKDVAQ